MPDISDYRFDNDDEGYLSDEIHNMVFNNQCASVRWYTEEGNPSDNIYKYPILLDYEYQTRGKS